MKKKIEGQAYYRLSLICSFIFCFWGVNPGFSQSDTLTKEKPYHLFNPTPKEQMRQMHTDRPDVTETPYTVDAGHLQFEFDFLNIYRHPISLKRRETDLLFLNGIAKIGITENLDFETVFSATEWHFPDKRNTPNDTITSRMGFGDLGFRLKYNLTGNKHERFGLAIMPSFLMPLKNQASEDLYVPGITLIWATELPNNMELGGQIENYRIYNRDKRFLHSEWWATIELGFNLVNKLSSFVEYVAILGENNAYIHTANSGLIYEVTPNFNLDAAFNLGLNALSPSTIFFGFSLRL